MKILWVKPGKILPLDTGGKLRTYNLLRHLCRSHSVSFLSYYAGPRDAVYEDDIKEHFPGAIGVEDAIPNVNGISKAVHYFCSSGSRIPYAVKRFAGDRVRKVIARLISSGRFDVAVCDFLASAPNFPDDLKIPTVLFQHNVEAVLWRRRAQVEKNWAHRIVAKIESAKMSRYEAEQLRRFHHIFAVSEHDRELMGHDVGLSRISVIPTGVDVGRQKYDPEARSTGLVVAFAGSMDWEPNIDAVEFFCREIWPHVLRRVPKARFRIIGREPHSRVRNLACENVEVTGTVSSMVGELQSATVLVVPLRAGSGTRIKIYEGMAIGKATVSTAVGAEGLDVSDGDDILLADDPLVFASHVVSLLRDERLRLKLESAAAASARRHDWSVIAAGMAVELRKVITVSSGRTASEKPLLLPKAPFTHGVPVIGPPIAILPRDPKFPVNEARQ